MKIAIMGYSGSGKSTLARILGERYEGAVLHFDSVQFLPGWEIRTQEEKERLTREFLDTHDSWVIDGNYSKLYWEERVEEADQIILILFNRFHCLYRVTKRFLTYRNQTRPDMGEGCNEKLDWEFISWVLHKGRTKKTKATYKEVQKKYKDKVVVLKTQKQIDEFLKK